MQNMIFLTCSVYLHLCRIHSYDALIGDLKTNQQKWKKVLLPSHCYNSPGASRAIYSAVRLSFIHRVTFKFKAIYFTNKRRIFWINQRNIIQFTTSVLLLVCINASPSSRQIWNLSDPKMKNMSKVQVCPYCIVHVSMRMWNDVTVF